MIVNRHIVMLLATGFYTGRIPFAPGTFGTLPGLAVAYGLSFINPPFSYVVISGFVICAVFIAHTAEGLMDEKDPGAIVIDEMAGISITLFLLPFTTEMIILGFVVFRFFDIVKPFPIKIIERNVEGGVGIVLDDIIAGVYAHFVLRVANMYLGIT